jgi:hypothetical protein
VLKLSKSVAELRATKDMRLLAQVALAFENELVVVDGTKQTFLTLSKSIVNAQILRLGPGVVDVV